MMQELTPDCHIMKEPRLEILERAVDRQDDSLAFTETIRILASIQSANGRLSGVRWVPSDKAGSETDQCFEFATRFSAAFGQMICLPSFSLTMNQFEHIQQYNRWIELIVSLSGFGSFDSFIRRLAPDTFDLNIDPKDILKFFCLYTPSSQIDFSFEALYHGNNVAFLITALGWLGSRYCFSERFFNLRERLLAWIPDKLNSVKLGEISLGSVTEPFFHSSYAFLQEKHRIKLELGLQLRRALLVYGCKDYDNINFEQNRGKRERPIIVVSAEYLNVGHSIYRTHSKSVRSLKSKFYVVGVIPENAATSEIRSLFDEVIFYPEKEGFFSGVKKLNEKILSFNPDVILHIGVGMRGHVIALANLKLAPINLHSYGHMATTHSSIMDSYILPRDFAGDPRCFSEKIIGLDRDAMPYEQRKDVFFEKLRDAADRNRSDDIIKIAVPGTVMKLNPVFFDALRTIKKTANKDCEFHFFPGFAVGLPYASLVKSIKSFLPDAEINSELPYEIYCRELAKCHFTISPFPYGNLNTVIESVALGLPGVCLDGPESHSHTDGALYDWLGFPSELNTNSIHDFIIGVVRMIDDGEWREHCRNLAKNAPLQKVIYSGHEDKFCEAVYQLSKNMN